MQIIKSSIHISVVIVLLSLCTLGQSDDLTKVLAEIDNGNIVDHVYNNKLLGIRLKIPKEMLPSSSAEIAEDLKEALAQMRKGKPSDQKQIDMMLRKDRIILSVDLPESKESIGGALSITVRKEEMVRDMSPMIDRTITFFTTTGQAKLEKARAKEVLSGVDVLTFTVSRQVEGGRVFSKLLCLQRKNHVITLSLTWVDDVGRTVLENTLKGIEFL